MPSEVSDHDKRSGGSHVDEDLTKNRTRVSRACTRCRTRKDRCDGLKPTCTTCQTAGQVCNYDAPTKKRGLPEGYVRGLEKLYALLIGKIDGFENATSKLLTEHRDTLVKIWNHATVGEDLHTIWKDSKVIHDLEALLASLDQGSATTGLKRKRDRDDDSSAAEVEPDLAFHSKPIFNLTRIGSQTDLQSALTTPKTPEVETVLPLNALQLLDHYFAHTHCWFPVLHRPQITRACYEVAKGRTQSGQQAMTPLLWAIFAYTSSQLKAVEGQVSPSEAVDNVQSALKMRSRCIQLMPLDPQEHEIVHAQAFLILALFDLGHGHWKSAWSYVGQAVRIVLGELGGRGTAAMLRPGTLQGCVILDTAIAAHLSCVPHLRRADVEAHAFMNEDGHEEWEPWNAPQAAADSQREPSFSVSCFNRLTEIFLTINDVLSLQPHINGLDRTYIQSLLAKLHQLQTTFPGQMPPSSQSPPHQIYLQLCHVSAQIFLVELPIDSGAGANERAKLACNVLSLLALCRNTPVIGLQHLPPFLVNGIEAALRLASIARASFGPLTGLPSYDDFYRTGTEFLTQLSITWPAYRAVLDEHRTRSQPPSQASLTFSPSPNQHILNGSGHRQTRSVFGHDGSPAAGRSGRPGSSQQANNLSTLNVASPTDLTFKRHRGTEQNTRMSLDQSVLGQMTSTPLQMTMEPMDILPNPQALNNMSDMIDFDMSSNELSAPMGLIMPETSPSFQGDEIDAIFDEMAHLDTNEWTDERVTGLKEFGFTDDLTFQAFCNDPDRLLAPPIGPLQTALSSESQTWMFAGADSSRP